LESRNPGLPDRLTGLNSAQSTLNLDPLLIRKDTLDAAQNDAEQLVMDKIATKAKLISRLETCSQTKKDCVFELGRETPVQDRPSAQNSAMAKALILS